MSNTTEHLTTLAENVRETARDYALASGAYWRGKAGDGTSEHQTETCDAFYGAYYKLLTAITAAKPVIEHEHPADLVRQLMDANKEITDLRARVAELETAATPTQLKVANGQ